MSNRQRTNASLMLAQETVRAALRSDTFPTEMSMDKAWITADVAWIGSEEEGKRYYFEILLSSDMPVILAICQIRPGTNVWGWDPASCTICFKDDRNKVWWFHCMVVNDDIVVRHY